MRKKLRQDNLEFFPHSLFFLRVELMFYLSGLALLLHGYLYTLYNRNARHGVVFESLHLWLEICSCKGQEKLSEFSSCHVCHRVEAISAKPTSLVQLLRSSVGLQDTISLDLYY